MVKPLVVTNDMLGLGDPKQEIVRAWREAEVNVMACGAVGDGVADDTAAILEAVRLATLWRGTVVLPPATYKLTSPIDLTVDHVGIIGYGAILNWAESGFAIHLQANYCVIEGLWVNAALTATGAIEAGHTDNVHHNRILRCLLDGTDKDTAGRTAIKLATAYSSYNTIEQCHVRNFYDGIVAESDTYANWFVNNRVAHYYRYGIDLGDSAENEILGGFFTQSPGRNAGDLTYAVHVGANGAYNTGSFSANPGNFSSPLLCDHAYNAFFVNSPAPYGPAGTATYGYWDGHGGLQLRQGRLRVGDSNVLAPLQVTARAVAPTSPVVDDVYLDDGTNTGHGLPAWRRWTGAAWQDIGGAS